MARYLARRLSLMALSIWGLATIVFLMIKAIPGDEAHVAAGLDASPAVVEQVRQRLGLDQSTLEQYFAFLGRLVHGDLGSSITTFSPVSSDLALQLPATIELIAVAMMINVLVSVPVGVLAASFRDRWGDKLARVCAVVIGGMPIFWLGFVLQWLLGAKYQILPVTGQISVDYEVPRRTGFLLLDTLLWGNFAAFGDAALHLLLPAAVVVGPFAATLIRTLRASLIGELEREHILVARAKGASRTRVVLRHGLRNAAIPTVTMLGLQVGWMFGATVLVEQIFARPGVGSYLTSAVVQKDSFAVLGSVFLIGLFVVVVNFMVDLLQLAIDPRVRAKVA